MHLRLVDYIFWIVAPFLQVGIVVAMYRRRMHRSYSYFFAYTIFQVASAAVLAVAIRVSYTAYYYTYYVNLILSCILSAAIVWSVTGRAFVRRPSGPLTSIFLYLCAAIVLIAVVGFAMNVSNGIDQGAVNDALLLFDRTVRISQVLLAAAIILVGRHYTISRKSFVFGMVFGFGAFAAANMLIYVGLSRHGLLSDSTLSRINEVAYTLACCVWLYYSKYGTKDSQGFDANLPGAPTHQDIQKSVARNRWFFRTAYDGVGLDR